MLLGDALFAHALELSTEFGNVLTRKIARAANDVCTGEIIQTQRRFDLKLSVPDYDRIIEMKTGALFAVATELGAFLNEATPAVIGAMRTFGLRFGTAGEGEHTITQVARQLGLAPRQAREAEERALRTLAAEGDLKALREAA